MNRVPPVVSEILDFEEKKRAYAFFDIICGFYSMRTYLLNQIVARLRFVFLHVDVSRIFIEFL